MPNHPPYRIAPITDLETLLAFTCDSLRANTVRAVDGMRAVSDHESIDARDALGMIHNDLRHTLAVIKASKEGLT